MKEKGAQLRPISEPCKVHPIHGFTVSDDMMSQIFIEHCSARQLVTPMSEPTTEPAADLLCQAVVKPFYQVSTGAKDP